MSDKRGFVVNRWLELIGQNTTDLIAYLTSNGEMAWNLTLGKFVGRANNVNDPFVQEALAATLTNKSIDADTNTITNIENADIKIAAAIDAAKIANGSVSNTEFQDLDGVTGNIQVQINNKAENSDLAAHIADTSTHGVSGEIVGNSDSQVLTNKTIDADLNSISNIEDADIKTGAAIARAKLAPGSNNHVIINDGSGVLSSEARLALVRGGSAIDNNQTNDSTTTGSAAELAAVSGHVRLTDASLVSLAMIPAASSGGIKFSLYNDTGNALTVLNNAGATAANRIFTGSGNDINFANGSSLSLVYDSAESKWLVVGGTGSGGGSWVPYSTENVAASGSIASSTLMGLQLRKVQGDSAPVITSNTPFGSSGGWMDGTTIRLVGQSNINTVTILNNDIAKGALLNGDAILGSQDSIELQYDSSLDRWIEANRS